MKKLAVAVGLLIGCGTVDVGVSQLELRQRDFEARAAAFDKLPAAQKTKAAHDALQREARALHAEARAANVPRQPGHYIFADGTECKDTVDNCIAKAPKNREPRTAPVHIEYPSCSGWGNAKIICKGGEYCCDTIENCTQFCLAMAGAVPAGSCKPNPTHQPTLPTGNHYPHPLTDPTQTPSCP